MKKALFVIDVQRFFENKRTKSIARKISNYIQKNGKNYSFIVFTVFKNNPKAPVWRVFKWKGCSKGKDIKIIKELADLVNNSEIVFRNTYSLFKVAQVRKKLKNFNIKQVDICGFDTDCCVLFTAYDLFGSGYKPVILENLCFSAPEGKLHKPALEIIEKNCGFLKKAK